MKLLKPYITIMLMLLAAACTQGTDEPVGQTVACRLQMTALDNSTRACWHDEAPEGGKPAIYQWEANSTDVRAMVYLATENRFLPWQGSAFYSPCTVSPLTDNRQANITSTKEIENAVVGARVYFILGGSALSLDGATATSRYEFPDSYNLTTTNSLEELKAYTFMYASSVVESVYQPNLTATPVRFQSAVACLRLIVENPSRHAYRIRRITMKAPGETKLFPRHLIWQADNSGLNIVEPDQDSDYRSAMSTAANSPSPSDGSQGGIEIAANSKQTYYMIIPPISNWKSVENLMFEIEYATGKTIMTTPASLLPVSKIPGGKLEAGRIYNLTFREMILDVDHVSVDDWVDNRINVGQVTVATSEVTLASVGAKTSVRIFVGHQDTGKLSATSKNGKVSAVIRYDDPTKKMYVDITRTAAGEDEVTINDLATNSFATVTVK